jgi:hypothetical protein
LLYRYRDDDAITKRPALRGVLFETKTPALAGIFSHFRLKIPANAWVYATERLALSAILNP